MELIVKVQKGKLRLGPDPVNWWNEYARKLGFQVMLLRQTHVEQLWSLPRVHGDPADRLLVAQAMAEGIPLITSDEMIRQYPVQIAW